MSTTVAPLPGDVIESCQYQGCDKIATHSVDGEPVCADHYIQYLDPERNLDREDDQE